MSSSSTPPNKKEASTESTESTETAENNDQKTTPDHNQPTESTSVSGSVNTLFDSNGQLQPADKAENNTSDFTFTEHQSEDIGRDVAEDIDSDKDKHLRTNHKQIGERTPEYN